MKTFTLLKLVAAAVLSTAMPMFSVAQVRETSSVHSTITPVKDLNKLFDTLDRNHDGLITAEEFRHLNAAMAGIGAGETGRAGEADSSAFRVSRLSDDDLHAVFSKLDTNQDNVLSLTEFLKFNEVVAQNGGKR